MNSKDLKIVAGSFITESKLTKESKKQLLNFIQHEACDHQIMALMLDGKIAKLDEQSKQIVEERFSNKYGNLNEVNVRALQSKMGTALKYGLAGIAGFMTPIGFGVPLGMAVLYLYRRQNDACRKKCSNEADSKVCYNKCSIDVANKIIATLKSELGKCGKTKKPEKCKKRITAEINKWEKKIQKLRMKY